MTKKRYSFIKNLRYISLLGVITLGLMTIIATGDGGGNGVTQTYTMTEYFPLTSSWETDAWTLFIAQQEQDINGIMTKTMVDTCEPKVNFWTNDENGLRMHGDINDLTVNAYSTPVVLADTTCKVGDKKETTAIIDEDTTKITSELVAVEDVSVPAGNFTGCLKFELNVYEITDGQEVFGFKETLWLAKNVGFVKAVNESSADDGGYIFAREGETRQLLSYHITKPSELTTDQQAIKELYKKLEEFFQAEDLINAMALFSDDYLDTCYAKDDEQAYWQDLFDNNSNILFFISPGEIVVNGNNAYAITENLIGGVNDANSEEWVDWERWRLHFIKENGEWKIYGDQINFGPSWINVMVCTETGETSMKIGLNTFNCEGENANLNDQIASLTITGPPGTSIDPDLKQDFHPEWGTGVYWRTDDISNATSGFYTFTLEDVNGNVWQSTDYLNLDLAQPLAILNPTSPVDGAVGIPPGDVTLTWDPVDNADYYRVELASGASIWPGSNTQVVANFPPNTDCSWGVRARRDDLYGDDYEYESRSDWQHFSTAAQ